MTKDEVQALSCQQFELITESNIKINGLSNINESLSVHYLIYRIDNLENGKHYIGQHHTENPLDSYVGSGKIIRRAVEKEGVENFVKTILFDFDNFEEMNEKEKELVPLSDCYPHDPMSYNILEGGAHQRSFKGPANGMYGKKLRDCMSEEKYEAWLKSSAEASRKVAQRHEWHKKMSEVNSGKNNPMYGKNWQDFSTPEKIALHNLRISQAIKGRKGSDSWKYLTPEQRLDRISRYKESMKGRNKGRKVMQLPGTNVLKAVRPDEVQDYLNQGYVFSSRQKREQIARMKGN